MNTSHARAIEVELIFFTRVLIFRPITDCESFILSGGHHNLFNEITSLNDNFINTLTIEIDGFACSMEARAQCSVWVVPVLENYLGDPAFVSRTELNSINRHISFEIKFLAVSKLPIATDHLCSLLSDDVWLRLRTSSSVFDICCCIDNLFSVVESYSKHEILSCCTEEAI